MREKTLIKNKGRIGKLMFGICPHCKKYLVVDIYTTTSICEECKKEITWENKN